MKYLLGVSYIKFPSIIRFVLDIIRISCQLLHSRGHLVAVRLQTPHSLLELSPAGSQPLDIHLGALLAAQGGSPSYSAQEGAIDRAI